MKFLWLIEFCLLFTLSCSKDKNEDQVVHDPEYKILSQYLNIPPTPYPYSTFDLKSEIKSFFEESQDNTPENNKVTNWGATLGRVLFYDKLLSINNSISCASCHIQKFGFSDTSTLSVGFEGGLTKRHSMALSNSRYYASGKFFWDERAQSLEEQVLKPIQDPIEMGMDMNEVRLRLENTDYYPILFKKAFSNLEITDEKISLALAQFVRSIISTDSKFDEGIITHKDPLTPFSNFSTDENRGKSIFFQNTKVNCSGCHITNAFVSDNPRNNGVRDGDLGAFEFNPIYQLRGAFKAPSLRNIAIRSPYMHNGSLLTLEEVIEHYNSGLTNVNDDLDPHLRDLDGTGVKMNLSQEDKNALLAFLHTLTDNKMIQQVEYSNPFKK